MKFSILFLNHATHFLGARWLHVARGDHTGQQRQKTFPLLQKAWLHSTGLESKLEPELIKRRSAFLPWAMGSHEGVVSGQVVGLKW